MSKITNTQRNKSPLTNTTKKKKKTQNFNTENVISVYKVLSLDFTKRKGEYQGKISISEKELNVTSRNNTYN